MLRFGDRTEEQWLETVNGDRYIRKVTLVGLVVNLLLSAFKFIAGILGMSQAMVADAVHSLSDTITDIAVIIGSYFWSSPPDKEHPHGHRRIETLVASFIGVMIISASIGIAWQAITTLKSEDSKVPGLIALTAAVVSLLCKEVLYRWTARVGKQLRSAALTANAWHHRQDAISSIPVFFAIGGAIVLPNWNFLDNIGAALVSVMILHAGAQILWRGIKEFLDEGASEAAYQEIKDIVYQNQSVIQVHKIRTRYVATNLHVDMHVVVNGSISVRQGHDIATDIKKRLLRDGPDIVDVIVHIEPTEEAIEE